MIYYWLAILDNVKNCTSMLCMISVISTTILTVAYIIGCSDDENLAKVVKKPCKVSWITLIISSILVTFVPSQKQAAFIIVAPAIVENKDVQGTLKNIPELTKLGTDYLVEMLKDAKKTSDQ